MKRGRCLLGSILLSFTIISLCAAPAEAILIDNGVSGDGRWSVDASNGGETLTGQIDPTGPGGLTDVIWRYSTYVDPEADGGAVNIGSTNITTPAFLSGPSEVTSAGNFAGPNGTINWTSVASIAPGSLIYKVVLTFSSSQSFGNASDVRVISYLDVDVNSELNDVLVETGTPGANNFQLLSIDGVNDFGAAHYADYNTAQAVAYIGWAADEAPEADPTSLRSLITGAGASYSIVGVIYPGLPSYSDPRFPGNNAYGPQDIHEAMAFDLDPVATNASVGFYLVGLPNFQPSTTTTTTTSTTTTSTTSTSTSTTTTSTTTTTTTTSTTTTSTTSTSTSTTTTSTTTTTTSPPITTTTSSTTTTTTIPQTEISCSNGIDDDGDGLVDCDDPDCAGRRPCVRPEIPAITPKGSVIFGVLLMTVGVFYIMWRRRQSK